MKQVRLEALKLAVALGGAYDEVLNNAEWMVQFIETAPVVVPIVPAEPEPETGRFRRKRRSS